MKYNFAVFPIIVFIEYKNECKFIILNKKAFFFQEGFKNYL
jgi:hypothetical protein